MKQHLSMKRKPTDDFVFSEIITAKDGKVTTRHAGGSKSGLMNKLKSLPNEIRYKLSKKGFVEMPTEDGGRVRLELKEKGVSSNGQETTQKENQKSKEVNRNGLGA